jgi:hypothetical protein
MFSKELKRSLINQRAYVEAIEYAKEHNIDIFNYKICFYGMLSDDEKKDVALLARNTRSRLGFEKISEIYVGCGKRFYKTYRVIEELY